MWRVRRLCTAFLAASGIAPRVLHQIRQSHTMSHEKALLSKASILAGISEDSSRRLTGWHAN